VGRRRYHVTVYVQRKQFAKFVPRIDHFDVGINGYAATTSAALIIRPFILAFEPVEVVSGLPQELHDTGVVACEYTTCASSHSLHSIVLNLLDGSGTAT